MSNNVKIIRTRTNDQGTEGILLTEKGFKCRTIELPWRDNSPNISCIPAGVYEVKLRISRKYGRVYHLQGTDPRTYILIHWGNFAGDKSKGFKTHSAGCILLGQKAGVINNQKAVLNSRTTCRRFMQHMGEEPFELEIIEVF